MANKPLPYYRRLAYTYLRKHKLQPTRHLAPKRFPGEIDIYFYTWDGLCSDLNWRFMQLNCVNIFDTRKQALRQFVIQFRDAMLSGWDPNEKQS